MPGLEFRDPALLWIALLAIPIYLLARRRGGRLLFSSLRLLPAGPTSLRARLLYLPSILLSLATASLAIALAGPRVGDRTTRVQKEGIAIMMVADISGSMRALDLSEEDLQQSRLDAVKTVFQEFVAGSGNLGGRPDDAIGLVSFARYADCRCPLTLDHANLLLIAEDLEIVTAREEDGTALGDGLGLALERLRKSKAASRIAILLTDGVNNAGDLTPMQAAQIAESIGVKVYSIGAGTEGFAPIPTQDPFTGRTVLRQMPVQIDEEILMEIADRTGGRYFRATDAETLREVYREIDRLERSRIAEIRYLQYEEYFPLFTGVGLAAAWLGWLLGATWLRRLP